MTDFGYEAYEHDYPGEPLDQRRDYDMYHLHSTLPQDAFHRTDLLPQDAAHNPEFTPIQLTPEETCSAALIDLQNVTPSATGNVKAFFESFIGGEAPADLHTSISTVDARLGQHPDAVPGDQTLLITTVDFTPIEDGLVVRVDTVSTDDGIRLYEVYSGVDTNDNTISYHGRQLASWELTALEADAAALQQYTIDCETERLGLGPLIEEANEQGERRFHVGDVLSVMTGRSLSPRGRRGVSDVLDYMTDDQVCNNQIGRFLSECAPPLTAKYEELLGPYIENIAKNPPNGDLEALRLIAEITETLGTSMLEVPRLSPEDHIKMDHLTEMELDYGSNVMGKLTRLENPEPDGDS